MKITNISNCSRCGGEHAEVEAEKLTRPFAPPEAHHPVHGQLEWTHWFPCPTNGQPVLVMTDLPADHRLDIS